MEEQKKSIFRQKSLERITSPEQFSNYLKVVTPEVWMVFAAIILIMIGLFIWSFTGNLENLEGALAYIQDGNAVVSLNTDNVQIDSSMKIRIHDDVYEISRVGENEYGRCVAYARIDKPDGIYEAEIVTRSIHPISFLFE